MKVTTSIDVDRDRAEVFDLMADARNEPTWNDKVSETPLTSGEPIGLGTVFSMVNRGQRYTVTITTYDGPDVVTFEVVGKQMTIVGDVSFADSGSGTTVHGAFDMQPKGIMSLMLPLMSPAVRKDFPKQMAGFKRFCESAGV